MVHYLINSRIFKGNLVFFQSTQRVKSISDVYSGANRNSYLLNHSIKNIGPSDIDETEWV